MKKVLLPRGLILVYTVYLSHFVKNLNKIIVATPKQYNLIFTAVNITIFS